MYDCDFAIKFEGVSYDFEHVDSLQIEDPQVTKLIRGSNAKNKEGIVYTEGAKEPRKLTCTIIGVDAAMSTLLQTIHASKARCEFHCISRSDGSSKIGKDAVLSMQPMQLQVDQSPESMNIALVFETFNLVEVHKV